MARVIREPRRRPDRLSLRLGPARVRHPSLRQGPARVGTDPREGSPGFIRQMSGIRLPAGPSRNALLREYGGPLLGIRAAKYLVEFGCVHSPHRSTPIRAEVFPQRHHSLTGGHSQGRVAGDLLRQLQRGRKNPFRRGDYVDQTPLQRGLRRDRFACEQCSRSDLSGTCSGRRSTPPAPAISPGSLPGDQASRLR